MKKLITAIGCLLFIMFAMTNPVKASTMDLVLYKGNGPQAVDITKAADCIQSDTPNTNISGFPTPTYSPDRTSPSNSSSTYDPSYSTKSSSRHDPSCSSTSKCRHDPSCSSASSNRLDSSCSSTSACRHDRPHQPDHMFQTCKCKCLGIIFIVFLIIFFLLGLLLGLIYNNPTKNSERKKHDSKDDSKDPQEKQDVPMLDHIEQVPDASMLPTNQKMPSKRNHYRKYF